MELFGQGAQGFCKQCEIFDFYGKLAAFRAENAAFCADDVADVEQAELGIFFFAHVVELKINLNLPVPVRQNGKTRFAVSPYRHNAPGNRNFAALFFFGKVGKFAQNVAGVVRHFVAVPERRDAFIHERLHLVAARFHQHV